MRLPLNLMLLLRTQWGQTRVPSQGHFTEQAEILHGKRITNSSVSESCMVYVLLRPAYKGQLLLLPAACTWSMSGTIPGYGCSDFCWTPCSGKENGLRKSCYGNNPRWKSKACALDEKRQWPLRWSVFGQHIADTAPAGHRGYESCWMMPTPLASKRYIWRWGLPFTNKEYVLLERNN